MATIQQRYAQVLDAVSSLCAQEGRDPASVRIVAVSKTVGLPQVAEAIRAGLGDFGENRTKPFCEKQEAFPDQRWHFIGRIQTNKVKDFVGRSHLVHSVASAHALEAIQTRAGALDEVQPLLIEVNVSGEESKDGVSPEGLAPLLEMASGMDNVDVRGLMTMAPQGDASLARRCFQGLRELLEQQQVHFQGCSSVHLLELSMGMSEDYLQAVREGATILRLGRTLFSDELVDR